MPQPRPGRREHPADSWPVGLPHGPRQARVTRRLGRVGTCPPCPGPQTLWCAGCPLSQPCPELCSHGKGLCSPGGSSGLGPSPAGGAPEGPGLRSGSEARVLGAILHRRFTCRPHRGAQLSRTRVPLQPLPGQPRSWVSPCRGHLNKEGGVPLAKASVRFLHQSPLLGALKTLLELGSVFVLLPWSRVCKRAGDFCVGAPSAVRHRRPWLPFQRRRR